MPGLFREFSPAVGELGILFEAWRSEMRSVIMKWKNISDVIPTIALVHPLWSQTPVTDLSGIGFIVDPGHSHNENVGIYGYAEAHKVLDVAFHLREFLRLSNADTVLMIRTNRIDTISITQRYTLANNLPHPNKWFHSIHSDAASIG